MVLGYFCFLCFFFGGVPSFVRKTHVTAMRPSDAPTKHKAPGCTNPRPPKRPRCPYRRPRRARRPVCRQLLESQEKYGKIKAYPYLKALIKAVSTVEYNLWRLVSDRSILIHSHNCSLFLFLLPSHGVKMNEFMTSEDTTWTSLSCWERIPRRSWTAEVHRLIWISIIHHRIIDQYSTNGFWLIGS